MSDLFNTLISPIYTNTVNDDKATFLYLFYTMRAGRDGVRKTKASRLLLLGEERESESGVVN